MIGSNVYGVARGHGRTIAIRKGLAGVRIRVAQRKVAARNIETNPVVCPEQVARAQEIDYHLVCLARRQRLVTDTVDVAEIVARAGERAETRPHDRSGTRTLSSPAKPLPDFCRTQLCTVVHGHAVCNGRDRKKQPIFKNLGVEYLATNQGVVGSSPAGRAKFLKGLQRCSPFVIYGLCRKRAVGTTLHGAQGGQAVRVRGQMFSRKVPVPPHHLARLTKAASCR